MVLSEHTDVICICTYESELTITIEKMENTKFHNFSLFIHVALSSPFVNPKKKIIEEKKTEIFYSDDIFCERDILIRFSVPCAVNRHSTEKYVKQLNYCLDSLSHLYTRAKRMKKMSYFSIQFFCLS